MLNHLAVRTSFGLLPVVGKIHTDLKRPGVLIVGGAFPPAGYLHEKVDEWAALSVVVGGLPSMVGPRFADQSIAAWSAAFDEAVNVLFANRPVITYGVSTGALVTLGMRSPQIRHHVVEEPFFGTAHLWPFIKDARARLAAHGDNKMLVEFLRNIFGITTDAVENRDYTHLLKGLSIPTDAIVGRMPLEPERPVRGFTSFTGAEDRARLAAHPLVTIHQATHECGHHVQNSPEGVKLVYNVMSQAVVKVCAEDSAGAGQSLRSA